MISFPLVHYVLTAALRDRLMVTLALMIVLGASLSVFLGSSAVVEQQSFAVVFGSGGLRFLGVIGIVLFISFYMRRAFENKEVEFLLSRPISRMCFLFSHAAAFIVLAVAVALCVSASVVIVGHPDAFGLLAWGGSLVAEYIIMAVAALFFSMVLSSASGSALACLGLYVLCRMIGSILGISGIATDDVLTLVLGKVMEVISVVIPRLDLIGQTGWLIYGTADISSLDISEQASGFTLNFMRIMGVGGFIVAQGAVFCGLLLTAASFDFLRKRF